MRGDDKNMSKDSNMTILAVPGPQPLILTNDQANIVLAKIKDKKTSAEERKRLAQDVKILFTKPEKKNNG